MTEKWQKLESLAREVLILSRNTLMVNLRFLDAALSRLEYFSIPEETEQEESIMTDGKYILYDPRYVLNGYRMEKEIPVRNYLHMVLHCVFCHMYMDPNLNRPYWDLACDIATENIISELGLKAAAAKREALQQSTLSQMKKLIGQLTAEKIYHHLVEQQTSPLKTAELRALFYADNHEIWYMTSKETEEVYGLPRAEGSGAGQGENTDEENTGNTARMEAAADWKQVSERMQMDLESFSKLQGNQAGSMLQNLAEVTREKYDYTGFLKKFAVMGERMKINDDEFDYIFYTYGLQLYDKMPLIEPLEYKEVKSIREFVIAIDTSGSTSGELVQKFIQKTYNILQSTESFFSKINLHIIQCDAEIQEHVKITTKEEFDHYLQTMTIKGLGGTDFRPVFECVDKLVREREFQNLKGLIYFTDGYGDFPKRKPDYETAFVFIDDEYNNPDVPPWAIKLVLQKEEI